jgi:hypothetical protein
MSTDNSSSVSIQAEALPIASVPAWFGEVALLAHTLTRLGLLAAHLRACSLRPQALRNLSASLTLSSC